MNRTNGLLLVGLFLVVFALISLQITSTHIPALIWRSAFHEVPLGMVDRSERLVVVPVPEGSPTYHNSTENKSLNRRLNMLAEQLVKVSAADGRSQGYLQQAITEVNMMLSILGQSGGSSKQEGVKEKRRIKSLDVCQEEYIPNPDTKLSKYVTQNCSYAPEFYTLITVVFNFVHYAEDDLLRARDVIGSVSKVYPKVRIIAGLPDTLKLDDAKDGNTTVYRYSQKSDVGRIWTELITQVKTKYVYMGRNVVHFTESDRLERLVREINNLEAYAVGSAIRGYNNGHWSHGCEQSILRNFTLVYTAGYYRSIEECLVCHHIHGPFVTKTHLFSEKKLLEGPTSTDVSVFASWFLDNKDMGRMAVVCPDSMAYVTDRSKETTTKPQWISLVKKREVEKIRLSNNHLLEFECSEAETYCSKFKGKAGLALSNCCLRELSKMIKFAIHKCKEFGLICHTAAGTTLGALKNKGILPWELDSDFWIQPENFTVYGDKVLAAARKQGYKTRTSGRTHYIYTGSWKVEMYKWPSDTIKLIEQGITPTQIEIDGEMFPTYNNPGFFGRNKYGHEIFQHAQHWTQVKSMSNDKLGYTGGSFNKCSKPGKHYCLDRNHPDGSIMFNEPIP